MVQVIGLTGGVGCGKSAVAGLVQKHYHCRLLLTDEIAREQMEPGGVAYQGAVKEFGSEILREDGRIDRKKLADIVFPDPQKLKRLNALTHPAVTEYVLSVVREERGKWRQEESDHLPQEECDHLLQEESDHLLQEDRLLPEERSKWLQEGRHDIVLIETALLIEGGYDKFCDQVWYVYAPKEDRKRRLMQSRAYSEEKINALFLRQKSEEEFRKVATAIIENGDGQDEESILAQIRSLL